MAGKQEALYWDKLAADMVQCYLCPHGCKIRPGQVGLCRVRTNQEGKLYSLNYGEVGALALDPIEKKPLYHFFPGHSILSVGTIGCNLACGFCQNYSLVKGECETVYIDAEWLVSEATRMQQQKGNIGIAYTYSEPLMWYEFVLDTARLARSQGLKNVLVTNGFIEAEPLKKLLAYIDAMNIDLKAFSQDFYRRSCKGKLDPVLETIELCQQQTHVEVTTLLVTGLNDSEKEIESLASWLAALNPQIALHLSRYHPAHRFQLPSTPVKTMQKARDIASRHLHYVYIGNVEGFDNDTYCSHCGRVLIRRRGYQTQVMGGGLGCCLFCGSKAPFSM